MHRPKCFSFANCIHSLKSNFSNRIAESLKTQQDGMPPARSATDQALEHLLVEFCADLAGLCEVNSAMHYGLFCFALVAVGIADHKPWVIHGQDEGLRRPCHNYL